MESSFLTFSPKALMRKKGSSKGVSDSQRLKIGKVKMHPLKIVDSPSSLHNIEKNGKFLSEASVIVLDDSSSLCGNDNKQDRQISYKTVHKCKDHCSEKELSISVKKKHDAIVLYDNTSNDKFNEIKLWLDELHHVHEQKSLCPVWSTPYIRNSGTIHSSESSSSKENSLKLRISETSTDDSIQFICATSTPLAHSDVEGCEDNPRRLDSVSESSSEESIKPLFRRKLKIPVSDSESSCYDSRSLPSKETNSCKSSHKLSTRPVLLNEQHSDGSNKNCNYEGSISSESKGSKGSVDRLTTEESGKLWEKKNGPPKFEVQTSFKVRKEDARSSCYSVDELLTNLYGDNWSREKVLTPLLNKKNIRGAKGKENAPPLKDTKLSKVNKPLRTFSAVDCPLHSAGAQKTIKSTERTKVTDEGKQKETLSFLRSLSASPLTKLCHSRALMYKKEFKKSKEALCSELFKLFNAEIFENQLPADMKIDWNIRMNRTAGFCYNSWKVHPEGRFRCSRIELSTKVCSSADRVRDTLLHELCHAATWVVDGYKNGHGLKWKAWARKAVKIFPELPPVGRCHNYDIQTKFTYRCKSCGYSIGRHSKSLDVQRKRCGYCYGEFELLVNAKSKKAETGIISTARTPRAASGFALYVKANYKIVKEKNSGLKHAEIMKLLGNQFSVMKVTSNP